MSTTTAKKTTATTEQRTADGRRRSIPVTIVPRALHRDRTYTIAQAAEVLSTSAYAVGRWVKLGYIPATVEPVTDGGRAVRKVTGADLADFVKGRAPRYTAKKATASKTTKATAKKTTDKAA